MSITSPIKLKTMNDIIKAAAGERYPNPTNQISEIIRGSAISDYTKTVTHFLSYLQSHGYAVVKVCEELNEIVAPHFKGDAKDYDVYPYVLDVARDALAIGASREREKAMKFAEWASGNKFKWNKAEKVWWNERTYESKTTSELWAIAEAEGVFTKNKEG